MSLDLGINPISFRFGLFHNVDCRPYWCKPFHDHYLLAYETDPFVQINITLQHRNARDQTSFSMFAQGFNSIFPPFVYNVEWSLKVTRDQQIYGRGWPMLLPNLFFPKISWNYYTVSGSNRLQKVKQIEQWLLVINAFVLWKWIDHLESIL